MIFSHKHRRWTMWWLHDARCFIWEMKKKKKKRKKNPNGNVFGVHISERWTATQRVTVAVRQVWLDYVYR